MKITDFDIYQELLHRKSGLALTADKTYLLESRLGPIAAKWGFANLETMAAALRVAPDKKLVDEIIEAMTTNETSFFRDMKPFDMFRDNLMPYMREAREIRKNMKIWCAASSSGQEPYTLAMLLNESLVKYPGWHYSITASDISHDILALAKAGAYSQFEVQRGLPIQLLMKYFKQDGQKWLINDDVKKYVQFQYFNLLDSMAALGKFDMIFCRNVLIYFDEKTKGNVLDRMAQQLEPDGFVMLGSTETIMGLTDSLVLMPGLRGVYVRPDSIHVKQPDKAVGTQALA